MAWRRPGDKPLSEPRMEIYWRIYASLGLNELSWWLMQQAITAWCNMESLGPQWLNTLRPRENWHHFADDIFKYSFLNENVWNPITISLQFVPKVPINNIPALVQLMTWRRPNDKPLSEPMVVSLPTHICITRPQWVILQIITWLCGFWRVVTAVLP